MAALIAALAGDAVSITGLAVTLPTVLLQTGYSRDAESEADIYAFRRLKEIALSPKYFAEIMTRLEEYHEQRTGSQSDGKKRYARLSLHPPRFRPAHRARACQPITLEKAISRR